MKIFIVGGSGYIGSHVTTKLIAQGASVTALSRSSSSDATLRALGASPARGDIGNVQTLQHAASASDCVVWAPAFDPAELPVLEALVATLAVSGGACIYVCGTAVVAKLTSGEPDDSVFAEDTPFTPPRLLEVRVAAEQTILSGARRGVRAMVIRPPLVFGDGGSTQIPALFDSALRSGAVRYIGRGLNRWSYIHIDDLSDVIVAALTRGTAGAIYHAVAGEADLRSMAEAAGKAVGVPAASWSTAEAEADSGYGKFFTRIVLGSSSRTTSKLTERALGWAPKRVDLLEDIQHGSYRSRFISQFRNPS